MNNLALNRIQEQLRHKNILPKNEIGFTTATYIPTPIPPEELQSTLEKLFVIEEPIVEVFTTQNTTDIKEFPDLFHFVEWYLIHQDKFSERQKSALKTLVEAKDLINLGCACKRQQRLNAANNYYQIFWQNNTNNDLLPTVLRICECKFISFGNFLQYPSTQQKV